MARAFALTFLVALFLLPAWSGPGQAGPSEEPRLWLDGGAHDSVAGNFTTYPPSPANESQVVVTWRSQVGLARASWRVGPLPGDWEITSDWRGSAELWVTKLDGQVPLPEEGKEPGRTRVVVNLRGGGMDPFASGELMLGAFLDGGDGPRMVEVPLAATQEMVPVQLFMEVLFYGYAIEGGQPEIHVLSDETPSSLLVPGFPIKTIRAWEDEYACLQLRLVQESCEAPAPTPSSDKESPLVAAPVALVLLIGLLGRLRRSQQY